MNINDNVKPTNTISAYLAGFLVHGTQIGVGVLGFQRIVAQEAGHDAWISVVLAGLLTHLTVLVITKTLACYPSADIYGIQLDVFGKWLGAFLGVIYSIYFFLSAMVILRTYVEVVQTWVFPNLPTWVLSAIILLLAVYTIMGGIRVVAGYTFFSVSVTIWLVCDLYYPLQFAQWEYLFPILEANAGQLFKGMIGMSLSSIGFEILYAIYPYIQNKERLPRSVQTGVLVTNLIYTFVMIVSLVFFSQGQLVRTIWATLNLKKMVYFPILERFELIAISIWLLVVLPNIMVFIWSSARGFKRLFGWNLRKTMILIVPVIYFISLLLVSRNEINKLNDIFAKIGMYTAYLYPFLLFVLVKWKQRKRRMKEGTADATVHE
ncbi:GerAB/ArcD/ProY family transporter [Brevibacillus choshinensis]|uniref:GerAB/ArcD/ProY family transporter n=1 Tax=Brevibacillus choshinensis TaxID=54911 RepID=A0ABX7FPW3_BRECH|nr:GerAB/ArcD/ProY family transporter [Brevibacillus choshinensis]QRG68126.1 GerAB/ArcD/ProY family transporter [Brevibacillus choshinensis]